MRNQRSVLILGYRRDLIDACEKVGVNITTLVDPWENLESLPPCSSHENRIFVENLAKDETIMFSLARSGNLKFDSVLTCEEFLVINASLLSLSLSTPFIDPKVAVAFRDKYYQKHLLRGVIPVTDSWIINDIENFSISDAYPYPVVLKPVGGAATADTYIANNLQELEFSINNHKEKLLKNRVEIARSMVIERFIQGDEWHVDGWISEGELQMFSASKYGFPLINIKNGGIVRSVTLCPHTHEELYEKLRPFIETSLHILGLENGVFHLEMFCNSERNEFVFSECAARIGGGLISKAFLSMFDIDLFEVFVRLSLGEKVKGNYTKPKHCAGWTFLPSVSKNTKCLPDPSILLSLDGVIHVEYSWEPGQEIPNPKEATTERTGMVLVTGENENQVNNRIDEVLKCFIALLNSGV